MKNNLLTVVFLLIVSGCGSIPPNDTTSPTACPWYQFVTNTQKQAFIKHERLLCKNTITTTWDIYTYPDGVVLFYESNATLVRVENGPTCVADMFGTPVPGPNYRPEQCFPIITL